MQSQREATPQFACRERRDAASPTRHQPCRANGKGTLGKSRRRLVSAAHDLSSMASVVADLNLLGTRVQFGQEILCELDRAYSARNRLPSRAPHRRSQPLPL